MKLLTHFGYFSDRPRISIYIRISTDFFKCIFSVIIIWDNIISLYFFLITLCNLSPYEKTRLVQILWDASVNWINRYIFLAMHRGNSYFYIWRSNQIQWYGSWGNHFHVALSESFFRWRLFSLLCIRCDHLLSK